jgi:tetratricopeptide (TPR) repeat protein
MDIQALWNSYLSGDHDAVISAGKDLAEQTHITGLSLVGSQRAEEGLTLLMASVMLQPRPDWYANACVALLEGQRGDFALSFALTGLKEFPNDSNLSFCAGNVFTSVGRFSDAKTSFENAVTVDPTHWEAQMNLANTLRRMGLLTEALISYDQVETLNPSDAGRIRTRINRAVTLCDLGFEEEALKIFDDLCSMGINSAEVDFNRSTLRLKLGDYTTGWDLYERRWDCPMAKADVESFRRPLLSSLEEGRGKHILFCHEQGFGDSIQFVRYAPMFAAHGISVTILVPQPLERLFACMGLPVVTSRDSLEYDFECPMLNAPRLFGTKVETIPWNGPYLTVPETMVQEAHDSLFALNKKLAVGIVWAGQSRDALEMKLIDNRRSINIGSLVSLLEADATFYSLQFGDRAMDYENALPEDYWPLTALQPGYDFLDTAAVIMNLDLVIAVDTSTAHLAAALGKPVWLLSRFDGCWRWLKDRTDSPWYPTIKIFNQNKRLDWSEVIQTVGSELESRIK